MKVQEALKAQLQPGYTCLVANTARDGSRQIEIRDEGCLCWRGWEFEPNFEADLDRMIIKYSA